MYSLGDAVGLTPRRAGDCCCVSPMCTMHYLLVISPGGESGLFSAGQTTITGHDRRQTRVVFASWLLIVDQENGPWPWDAGLVVTLAIVVLG